MDLVSVIVPVYNVEQFLPRCLDSILAQTHTHWEAVCVNDGSTDRSQEILQEYAAKDPRFRFIVKENGGPSQARNVGVSAANGEWIIFLDSDDFIHPQTLEIALALAHRENADVVTYCKEPLYKVNVYVRRALGLKTNSYVPRRFLKKRFREDQEPYHVTECMAEHLTEVNDRSIDHQIRRFYSWRYLLKRTVALKVTFLEGLIYEDFPWVSELALQRPRTVITQLPFYFYHPNVSSILHATVRTTKLINWVQGIEYLLPLYQARATPHERECWVNQCLWPVIANHLLGKLNRGNSDGDTRNEVIRRLKPIVEQGWLDAPPNTRYSKAKDQLLSLIAQLDKK